MIRSLPFVMLTGLLGACANYQSSSAPTTAHNTATGPQATRRPASLESDIHGRLQRLGQVSRGEVERAYDKIALDRNLRDALSNLGIVYTPPYDDGRGDGGRGQPGTRVPGHGGQPDGHRPTRGDGRDDRGPRWDGPRGGDWRRPQHRQRNEVVAHDNNQCTQNSRSVNIRGRDECAYDFPGHEYRYVQAVSLNGQCVNTVDQLFPAACPSLVALARDHQPEGEADEMIELHQNNACNQSLTSVDVGVDCAALSGVLNGRVIGSLKLNNRCLNIYDVSFNAQTCQLYQDALVSMFESDGRRRRSREVIFFGNNECTTEVTRMQRGYNCTAFNSIFGRERVAAYKIGEDGACRDIDNTTFQYACPMLENYLNR